MICLVSLFSWFQQIHCALSLRSGAEDFLNMARGFKQELENKFISWLNYQIILKKKILWVQLQLILQQSRKILCSETTLTVNKQDYAFYY